jgi:hypothetical protein
LELDRRRHKVEVSRDNLRRSIKMREAVYKTLRDEREAHRLENEQQHSDFEKQR